MSPLTTMRRALWDAINTYPATANAFRKRLTLEKATPVSATGQPVEMVAPKDLPAIAIAPTAIAPTWMTNQAMELPYSLQVEIWTAEKDLELAERLATDVIYASFHRGSDGEAIILRECGHYPAWGSLSISPAVLPSEFRVWHARLAVTLTTPFHPEHQED